MPVFTTPYTVTWTQVTYTVSAENRLEWLEESLQERGWVIKDRSKALAEMERYDGVIEIVKE